MPTSDETPFAAYLHTVLAHLSRLTPAQRADIQAELEAHLADAAQERGRHAHDPVFQAAVIAELGPAKRLGKAWAQTYRSSQGTLPGSTMVVFWGLWVLASMVSRIVHALSSSDTTFMWSFPLVALAPIVLQSLLLREVAGVPWWRSWLLVSLSPWLALTGLYLVVPWATLTEGSWERIFFSSMLLTGMALGVGQWRVLHPHVPLAEMWIIVPLGSLVAAWMLAQSIHINLVVYELWSSEIARIRGWEEVALLRALIFGATDGIMTGTIFLGLLRLGTTTRPHQRA